ncbi:MAG: hypothetical protein H0T76_20065 [Nannocystis sp.]|nr:hypothetical protein [Nannocystis sp.]MBA3548784.1 hypothetical protein [Nannocystis sp.]
MRIARLSLFVVAALTLACGGSAADIKMTQSDLAGAGINASISAPEGATIAKDEFSGADIKKGDDYEMTIREKAADLAKVKSSCTNATHKNCEVVLDEPNAVITKWVQFKKNVHKVSANVETEGKTFGCTSDASKSGVAVERDLADLMLKACRSLAAKTG